MKEQIGQTAGAIWKVLQTKDKLALSQVPKAINEKESLAFQAVGWLAREDKIEFRTEGKTTYVTLTTAERRKA